MAGLGKFLTLAGGVVGGVLGSAGGPGGAIGGAAAGSSLGGAIGGMIDPEKELQQRIQQKQQVGPVETSMTRRKYQLDQTPLRQIRESIDSLKYVNNDAMRMELAKPLLEAEYMAKAKV